MARWEFKLPDIGEGVAEGEIVAWLVKPGDVVVEDQPMVEVMTDKATVTIGSPRTGSIVETRGAVGDIVPVHAVLVVFELGGQGAGVAPDVKTPTQPAPKPGDNGHAKVNGTTAKSDEGPAATAVGDIREDLPGMGPPPSVTIASRSPSGGETESYFNAKPL